MGEEKTGRRSSRPGTRYRQGKDSGRQGTARAFNDACLHASYRKWVYAKNLTHEKPKLEVVFCDGLVRAFRGGRLMRSGTKTSTAYTYIVLGRASRSRAGLVPKARSPWTGCPLSVLLLGAPCRVVVHVLYGVPIRLLGVYSACTRVPVSDIRYLDCRYVIKAPGQLPSRFPQARRIKSTAHFEIPRS